MTPYMDYDPDRIVAELMADLVPRLEALHEAELRGVDPYAEPERAPVVCRAIDNHAPTAQIIPFPRQPKAHA